MCWFCVEELGALDRRYAREKSQNYLCIYSVSLNSYLTLPPQVLNKVYKEATQKPTL